MHHTSRRLRLTVAAIAVLAALVACGSASEPVLVTHADGQDGDSLHGTEVTGLIPRPALVLPDTSGKPFDLQDRPDDEVTALFFGYTNCPDVCPMTMANLAAAERRLDRHAQEALNVVFVTEDPKSDTPVVLRTYLDRFSTSFTGLMGGGTATEPVLDALKASRTEIVPLPPPSPGAASHPTSHVNGSGEAVEHVGSVYLFHRDRVVVYTGGTTPTEYAEDVHELLS